MIISKKRFLFMALGTLASGLVLSVLMALGGSFLLRDGVVGWGGLVGGLTGMVIGYPLGVMAGVVFTRFGLKCPGSLWLGLLGSLLPLFLVMGLAEALNFNGNANLMFSIFFLAAPLLATLGFHLRLGGVRTG